ncbi:MAG: hypothetical protein IMZ53_02890 [Thermoplasmata archaeon]|nr:hypothetical protein [Thermoplasmata archaeon]
MAAHEFICPSCGYVLDTSDTRGHDCPKCGAQMYWNLKGAGIAAGDYNHVSDSLAISPEQIPEHRQHFPDVDVLPDGRPHFTSVSQQSRYLEKAGFDKKPQRIRSSPKSNAGA